MKKIKSDWFILIKNKWQVFQKNKTFLKSIKIGNFNFNVKWVKANNFNAFDNNYLISFVPDFKFHSDNYVYNSNFIWNSEEGFIAISAIQGILITQIWH